MDMHGKPNTKKGKLDECKERRCCKRTDNSVETDDIKVEMMKRTVPMGISGKGFKHNKASMGNSQPTSAQAWI
jgi:hypothetical protein